MLGWSVTSRLESSVFTPAFSGRWDPVSGPVIFNPLLPGSPARLPARFWGHLPSTHTVPFPNSTVRAGWMGGDGSRTPSSDVRRAWRDERRRPSVGISTHYTAPILVCTTWNCPHYPLLSVVSSQVPYSTGERRVGDGSWVKTGHPSIKWRELAGALHKARPARRNSSQHIEMALINCSPTALLAVSALLSLLVGADAAAAPLPAPTQDPAPVPSPADSPPSPSVAAAAVQVDVLAGSVCPRRFILLLRREGIFSEILELFKFVRFRAAPAGQRLRVPLQLLLANLQPQQAGFPVRQLHLLRQYLRQLRAVRPSG